MNKKIAWLELHDPEVVRLEDSILPESFEVVRPVSATDSEEHKRLVEDADYIIAGSIRITREYMQAARKLKMIQKSGIGVDKIDCVAAKEMGIPVCITAGANAVPVAELTMGLMFAVNRRISYVDASMRRGEWVRPRMRAQCRMIHGKTVGLLGIGNIAREVAKMLQGFEGTRIIYYDKIKLSDEEERRLKVTGVSFEELLRQSDILSIHIPLLPSTRHMIGKEQLAMMKSSSILINTARGGIVDESALIEALKNGTLRGAGLDSFEQEPINQDNELLTLGNVVLSCHCGGGVVDNVLHVTEHVYGNIVKHASGQAQDPRDVIVPSRE
ncbi:MAG: phosphoglycerate dehydrogenase [Lachnospiraceae bacterium]|nr:phosphoglycerate dehydrogenase [Lachnospiraceae bacterium]